MHQPTLFQDRVNLAFTYLLLSACMFLGACSHFEHHDHGLAATNENSASNPVLEKPLTINLNGNNKWLMDAHTRSVTTEMMSRFSALDLTQQNQESLAHLGEQLSQDLDNLIQGCTMKGAAHNALHEFLMSYMPALENLKTTGSIHSAKHVQHLLAEFTQYFE